MRKFLEASILQNRTVLNSIDKPTSLMAIVNILIKSMVLKALSSMHKSKINTSFSLRAGEVLINFQIFTCGAKKGWVVRIDENKGRWP